MLGRIGRARAAKSDNKPSQPDHDWHTFVMVKFRAHRSLSAIQRMALERDFQMRNGVGRLRVRKAMLIYTLAYPTNMWLPMTTQVSTGKSGDRSSPVFFANIEQKAAFVSAVRSLVS